MSASASGCPRCRYEVGVVGLGLCPECGLELEWRPVGRRLIHLGHRWLLAFATAVFLLNMSGVDIGLAAVWSNHRVMTSERAALQAELAAQDLERSVQGWWHGTPIEERANSAPPRLQAVAGPGAGLDRAALRSDALTVAALPALASVLSLIAVVALGTTVRKPMSDRGGRNVRAVLGASLIATVLGIGGRFIFGVDGVLLDLLR